MYEYHRTAKPAASEEANVGRTLRVLKIACNGAEVESMTVPLLKTSAKLAEDKKFNKQEQGLGHIPVLWDKGAKKFRREHRSLVTVHATQLSPEWKSREEDYYMYKCDTQRAGLEANKFLCKVCGTVVYGDVFIFKRESDAWDMEPRVSEAKIDTSETPTE